MLKLPPIAGLEGLLDLDRQGVDIRTTLLRVLTDQYLQNPAPAPDEVRQYTELALRLLDETDIATRAAVAARLAPHARAPRPIVEQLARDVLEVAEPILLHSPCLTPADLKTIAAERGPCYAAIIAKRGKPRPEREDIVATKRALTGRTREAAPEEAPPRAIAGVEPPARGDAEPETNAEPTELCELFFAAGAPERRLILLNLDYASTTSKIPPAAMQRADIWRLESAALQHNTEAVIRDLERALGVSRQQARRIVNDELGEPIVVVAKAMELPADVLQRMLLFMNPRVGQSVDRVYELAALYHEVTVEAARRLIAIWRNADPPEMQSARHEASWQDVVENARQALSEITRRAPTRRGTMQLRPSDRAVGTDKH